MADDKIEIGMAAKLLGRELCGRVEHVCGTSVPLSKTEPKEFELWVCVDSKDAILNLPSHYRGYQVHIDVGDAPRFA